jgi:hypothetical protein
MCDETDECPAVCKARIRVFQPETRIPEFILKQERWRVWPKVAARIAEELKRLEDAPEGVKVKILKFGSNTVKTISPELRDLEALYETVTFDGPKRSLGYISQINYICHLPRRFKPGEISSLRRLCSEDPNSWIVESA